MKRLVALSLIALLLGLGTFTGTPRVSGQEPAPAPEGNIYRAENPLPDQYVVVLRNDIAGDGVQDVAGELAVSQNGIVLRFFYETSLNGFAMQMKEEAALAVSLDPRVEFVAEVDALKPALEDSNPSPGEEIVIVGADEAPPGDETIIPIVPGPVPVGISPPTETTETGTVGNGSPESDGQLFVPDSGPQPNLVADLTTNPTENLGLAGDPRYFSYGLDTVALLGVSGSYVPHVARYRQRPAGSYDPIKENCTFDKVGTWPDGTDKLKYQVCVQQLKSSGLNHMQIWLFLNHSLGKRPIEAGSDPVTGSDPYADEQPFTYELPPSSTPTPTPGPHRRPRRSGGTWTRSIATSSLTSVRWSSIVRTMESSSG